MITEFKYALTGNFVMTQNEGVFLLCERANIYPKSFYYPETPEYDVFPKQGSLWTSLRVSDFDPFYKVNMWNKGNQIIKNYGVKCFCKSGFVQTEFGKILCDTCKGYEIIKQEDFVKKYFGDMKAYSMDVLFKIRKDFNVLNLVY